MLVAALALGGMGAGCPSSRDMGAVTLSKEKNVTLIQTQDVYSFALLFPIRLVHQFWKCSEAPGWVLARAGVQG
jgi:hypothetical protein